MKVLHPSLNILNIKCDGTDNTKQQCSFISTAFPSKKKVGESELKTT